MNKEQFDHCKFVVDLFIFKSINDVLEFGFSWINCLQFNNSYFSITLYRVGGNKQTISI